VPLPREIICFCLLFLAASCAADVRGRRIPNALIYGAILLGVAVNVALMGGRGLLGSVIGLLGGGLALLVPFWLGGVGAGDVKMMAALGAILGPVPALIALLLGMVIGGVLTAVQLAFLGRLREKLGRLRRMVSAAASARSVAPLRLSFEDPEAVSMPYSVPLALGTLLVLTMAAPF
jgi:prepilin peptidase CpaA